MTSEQYEKEGIPWFNLEGFSDVPKSEKLSKLKSVQAGMVELGVEVDTISPKVTPPRQIGRGVADGFW